MNPNQAPDEFEVRRLANFLLWSLTPTRVGDSASPLKFVQLFYVGFDSNCSRLWRSDEYNHIRNRAATIDWQLQKRRFRGFCLRHGSASVTSARDCRGLNSILAANTNPCNPMLPRTSKHFTLPAVSWDTTSSMPFYRVYFERDACFFTSDRKIHLKFKHV